MDKKYVLASILREAERFGGRGNLLAAVRLTGAVNGARGEGYWLLFERVLVLLYRNLAERDYQGGGAELAQWGYGNIQEVERYAVNVDLSYGNATYNCALAPTEYPDAETILNAIRKARQAAEKPCTRAESLLAGVLYAWCADHESEVDYLKRLLDKRLLRSGMELAKTLPPEKMARDASGLFTDEQKISLILNYIAMRMSDRVWNEEEQQRTDELAGLLGMPTEQNRELQRLMVLKQRCPELFH